MNRINGTNGLFVTRKAIDTIRQNAVATCGIFNTSILWVMMAATLIISCQENSDSQRSADAGLNNSQSSVARDSVNKPKVNIRVNRHYDDKGNLIGFDSTYSSYYSNIEGDTLRTDSLMRSFDRYFSKRHAPFFDRQFNTLFFNDSLRPDFFHSDFFQKRYELNDAYLKNMMRSMDSIKNRFYQQQHKKGNANEL